VAFSDFELRGVVARRRVAFFGQSYDRGAAGPIPEFLQPVKRRLAEWAGLEPGDFAMALINEYAAGGTDSDGTAMRRSTSSSAASHCCPSAGCDFDPTARRRPRARGAAARPAMKSCWLADRRTFSPAIHEAGTSITSRR
jgi:hypothetical protein